jgi:hypothetical protein
MLFIIISLFIFFISYVLFKQFQGTMSLSYFMPYTFMFYFSLGLEMLCGSTLMYLGVRSHPDLRHVVNNETYLLVLLSIYYIMIALPLSMIIFKNIFINTPKLQDYINKPICPSFTKQDSAMYIVFSFLSLLGAFL